jgi:putative DNA primase/helicase
MEDVANAYHLALHPSSGNEHKALCPFHNEKTPSFNVYPDDRGFACFGCGEAGSVIDFVMKWDGLSNIDAAWRLADMFNVPTSAERPISQNTATNTSPKPIQQNQSFKPKSDSQNIPQRDKGVWVYPVPNEIERLNSKSTWRFSDITDGTDKKTGEWIYRKITHTHHYKDLQGQTLGYVVRAEWNEDGKRKKTFKPLTLRIMQNGSHEWLFEGFTKPYPLYGLDLLTKYPEHKVIIVEGEKKCDAANQVLIAQGWIALSLYGGSAKYKDAKNIDLSPLKGRDCVCWPDNDVHINNNSWNSFKSMRVIAAAIKAKVMEIPDSYPAKWDVGDAVTKDTSHYIDDIVGFIETCAVSLLEIPNAANDNSTQFEPIDPVNNEYYKLHGYDFMAGKMRLYFYSKRHKDMVVLSISAIQAGNVGGIATDDFFRGMVPPWVAFSSEKKVFRYIADLLSDEVAKLGVYDPAKEKGRGIYEDGNRSIIHLGDCIVENKTYHPITEFQGTYNYAARKPLKVKLDNELTTEDGERLFKVISKLNWEKQSSPVLFIGWLFLAPLSGILEWRPHIWLHGEGRSGKSWILDEVINKALGPLCHHANSGTTEPGLRLEMQNDALPVLYDEAESDDAKAQLNITNILEMARRSSRRTKSHTFKGTTDGRSASYQTASMFCMASVNSYLVKPTDKTRFAMLGIKLDRTQEALDRFNEVAQGINDIITKDFHDRLLTRAYRNINRIKEVIRIFQRRVAYKFNDNRSGDQYGTLLAGYYCMVMDNVPTEYEVDTFINNFEWFEEQSEFEETNADQALRVLKQHKVQFRQERGVPMIMHLADAVEIVATKTALVAKDAFVEVAEAERLLRLYGIRIEDDWIYITNTSEELKKVVFKDTPWAFNYEKVLKGINGASIIKPNGVRRIRFSTSSERTRFTAIPINVFLGQDESDNTKREDD